MSTYGRRTVLSVGRSIQVTADGRPVAKAAGVTIDWSKVNVQSSTADLTFEDNDIVYAGEKFLRYGQIVVLDSATGKYVPWGSAGTDNITTAPAKGSAYILNESVHENQPHSDYPPVIDGGRVFKNRLLVSEVVSATGPSDAVFTVTVDATSGNFHLDITTNGVLGGTVNPGTTQSTAPVAYNVSAANLKTAIIALTTVQDLASGNVDVTLSGSTYTITFHDINVSVNAVSDTLAGNSASVKTSMAVPGVQVPLASGVVATFPALADFEAAFPQISYVPE